MEPMHGHEGDVLLTFLSFWYLLQTSLVRPAAALAGLSEGTMLWLTSAERCVRTVDRCRQCASPAGTPREQLSHTALPEGSLGTPSDSPA